MRGRKCADELIAEGIAEGRSKEDVASHIFHMGFFDGMNDSPQDRAFDRGIIDRLNELGYKDDNEYH